MKYQVVFTVAGRGRFPVDMLRYDECFPVNGDSAAAIGVTREEEGRSAPVRKVRLLTRRASGYTAARWASFGWTVLENPEAVDSSDDLPQRSKVPA